MRDFCAAFGIPPAFSPASASIASRTHLGFDEPKACAGLDRIPLPTHLVFDQLGAAWQKRGLNVIGSHG
jgi:hypothetical protein